MKLVYRSGGISCHATSSSPCCGCQTNNWGDATNQRAIWIGNSNNRAVAPNSGSLGSYYNYGTGNSRASDGRNAAELLFTVALSPGTYTVTHRDSTAGDNAGSIVFDVLAYVQTRDPPPPLPPTAALLDPIFTLAFRAASYAVEHARSSSLSLREQSERD